MEKRTLADSSYVHQKSVRELVLASYRIFKRDILSLIFVSKLVWATERTIKQVKGELQTLRALDPIDPGIRLPVNKTRLTFKDRCNIYFFSLWSRLGEYLSVKAIMDVIVVAYATGVSVKWVRILLEALWSSKFLSENIQKIMMGYKNVKL